MFSFLVAPYQKYQFFSCKKEVFSVLKGGWEQICNRVRPSSC